MAERIGNGIWRARAAMAALALATLLAALVVGLAAHVEEAHAEVIDSGTFHGVDWRIEDGVLHIGKAGEEQEFIGYTLIGSDTTYQYWPWYANRESVTSVVVDGPVDSGSVGSLSGLFYGMKNCTDMDLGGLDVSRAYDTRLMFYGCSALTSLDLSSFDTSNVKNMYRMFYGCNALASLDLGDKFDTSNVTNMHQMFYSCKALTSLDLGDKFDTSKVTSMGYMFNGCNALTSLDLGDKFDTSKVKNMGSMFSSCNALASLDLGDKFDTSNVTNMHQMFYNCNALTSLDLGDRFDTSNVTSMRSMFYHCNALTSLDLGDRFDTSKVTDMNGMFSSCYALTTLNLGDEFNTSNVTNMNGMFSSCNALESVYIGPYNPFAGSTSSVTSALPANTKGGTCTGKWVRDDESYGPYTTAELRDNYTSAMAGTWVLEVVPTKYTLAFASDIGTGSMEQVKPVAAEDYAIPASGFVYPGKHVVSWDDGNGHVWPAGGTIPANTYAAGDKVTLTAVWEDMNNVKKLGKGTYEVELQPGMQATLPDVPAGTPYRVYEETEDGWVLVSQSSTTGTVQPLQTSTASFTNQYAPEIASAVLYGSKLLDGRAAEAGSYSFELYEGEAKLQEKQVADGGAVVFDPLTYDEAGMHVYTVREVIGDDSTLTYDTHVETVNVLVQEVDGHLTARVEYDDDGVRFHNKHNPGNLLLTKQVEGQTAANADDEFEFKVTLRNPNGEPVSEGVYLHYSG